MPANPLPFAVNTYSYTLSHAALDCVRHLSDQGFTAFELMMYPGHLWPPEADGATRRALRRLFEANGLRLVTLNMPNIDMNLAGASPEMRAYTLDLLEQIVRLAGELGAEGVVVGPGKANPLFPAPAERLVGHFFAALDRLAPLAETAGTRLWVENMPFAFLPDADGMMAALERYGRDDIGVVYDVANAVFIKEDLAGGFRRVQPRLKLVHLSDTGLGAYRHDPVGLGVVPFAAIPAMLAEVGHRDRAMLEIISPHADADIRASVDRLLAMGWPAS